MFWMLLMEQVVSTNTWSSMFWMLFGTGVNNAWSSMSWMLLMEQVVSTNTWSSMFWMLLMEQVVFNVCY